MYLLYGVGQLCSTDSSVSIVRDLDVYSGSDSSVAACSDVTRKGNSPY